MPTPNAPTIKQLRLDHLMVDRRVQRQLSVPRVSRIAQNFKPEAFGVLVVSHRPNGEYHILDGQHRRAGAIAAGREEWVVECQVYEGLSREQEAAMFLLLNDKLAVNPLEKFLVRVIEGDPVAVQLSGILDRHGWEVSAQPADGKFAAVSSLERIARGAGMGADRDNFEIADLTVQILTSAWGHNRDAVRGDLLLALGMVLLRYHLQVDVPKLLNQLAATDGGPRGVLGRGRGLAKLRGGRVVDGIADVMVNLHNKGRRTDNRLPEWRTTD